MTLVSQAQFAREMGVSQEAVKQAIQAGRVVSWKKKGNSVLIDSEKAKVEWAENTQHHKRPTKPGESPTINQSRTILEEYRAKMAQQTAEA